MVWGTVGPAAAAISPTAGAIEVDNLVIDLHAHHIPAEFLKWAEEKPGLAMATVQTGADGIQRMVHEQGYVYPLPPGFTNIAACRAEYAAAGVDFTLLSPAPPLFYYWADDAVATDVAKVINEGMAAAVATDPAHFAAVGTLPLGDAASAARAMEYGLGTLGLKGFLIGTDVEGRPLDHPDLSEFWQTADRLGTLLILHPYYVGSKENLEDYYLTNLVGNPYSTGLAAARLILSGVLDRYPNVRLMLVHGGGYFPYQIGRLDHGYQVRPETKSVAQNAPSHYLRRFFYDTVTFNQRSLQFLINLVGDDRVVLGTDYPFDMGDWPPSPLQEDLGVAASAVLGGNARKLLGIP